MNKAKFLLLVGAVLIAAWIAVSCSSVPPSFKSSENNGKWFHVKSPLAGRCYEVAIWDKGSTAAIAGMAEIPCSEAQLDLKPDK